MQHTWIFQLAEDIPADQQAPLQASLVRLTADWKAHGAPVPGEADIRHDRFVVVQAEPGSTSGCSIDAMTHGVEDLLSQAQLRLLPPNYIFFRHDDGTLDHLDFRDMPEAIRDGRLHAGTIVYDSSLNQTNDLKRWEVKLQDSWLARDLG